MVRASSTACEQSLIWEVITSRHEARFMGNALWSTSPRTPRARPLRSCRLTLLGDSGGLLDGDPMDAKEAIRRCGRTSIGALSRVLSFTKRSLLLFHKPRKPVVMRCLVTQLLNPTSTPNVDSPSHSASTTNQHPKVLHQLLKAAHPEVSHLSLSEDQGASARRAEARLSKAGGGFCHPTLGFAPSQSRVGTRHALEFQPSL